MILWDPLFPCQPGKANSFIDLDMTALFHWLAMATQPCQGELYFKMAGCYAQRTKSYCNTVPICLDWLASCLSCSCDHCSGFGPGLPPLPHASVLVQAQGHLPHQWSQRHRVRRECRCSPAKRPCPPGRRGQQQEGILHLRGSSLHLPARCLWLSEGKHTH